MSKGTVRFPESAIAVGRVGTARIRETIAGAAARLASTEEPALDAALTRLAAPRADINEALRAAAPGIAAGLGISATQVIADWQSALDLSPVQRMQALGRLPRGKKNKTESAYELEQLAPRLHAGDILWYRFEAHKLRLADNTFYTPDFTVIVADGSTEYHEVKGRWTDKARAKTKVAASQYPHRFIAIKRSGRRGWSFEDLTSRSW